MSTDPRRIGSTGSGSKSTAQCKDVNRMFHPMFFKQPALTLDDALALWDALIDEERRTLFSNCWEPVQEAQRTGNVEPLTQHTEGLYMTVLMEKLQPGFHAEARESLARGPAHADELIDVASVTDMLRS